jgi:hypothetical protein
MHSYYSGSVGTPKACIHAHTGRPKETNAHTRFEHIKHMQMQHTHRLIECILYGITMWCAWACVHMCTCNMSKQASVCDLQFCFPLSCTLCTGTLYTLLVFVCMHVRAHEVQTYIHVYICVLCMCACMCMCCMPVRVNAQTHAVCMHKCA